MDDVLRTLPGRWPCSSSSFSSCYGRRYPPWPGYPALPTAFLCASTGSVIADTAFTVMRDGFPLLKRQFLYENPFSQPDLARWKKRVLEAAPGADVEAMERNLLRVAPSFNLHRSFAVRTAPTAMSCCPSRSGPTTSPTRRSGPPSTTTGGPSRSIRSATASRATPERCSRPSPTTRRSASSC